MSSSEVVVIGAGVVGLATAYYLRQRGAAVRVLDAGAPGAGCSVANAGWVSPSFSSPVPAPGVASVALRAFMRPTAPVAIAPSRMPVLAPWLTRFAIHARPRMFSRGQAALATMNLDTLRLYDELVADGVSIEWSSQGIICAFLDGDLARRSHAMMGALREFGLPGPGALVDGSVLREMEPALSPAIQSGYLCGDDRAINPKSLVDGLVQRLRDLEVDVESNVRVAGFRTQGQRVTTVLTNKGPYPVGQLLIAAGAGTAGLARQLGTALKLEIAKGYALTIRLPGGLQHAVSCGDRKVACTPDGDVVRVAGILELSGDNFRFDAKRVEGVVDAAAAYLNKFHPELSPNLLDSIENLAIGQRTMTPNGLPVLDRLRRWQNAFVSSGHAMLGITMAPASGAAMAEYMTTGRRPRVLTPFAC